MAVTAMVLGGVGGTAQAASTSGSPTACSSSARLAITCGTDGPVQTQGVRWQ